MQKIVGSRMGSPRYGITADDENRKPGEVVTYKLSEEELAKYKSVTPPKTEVKFKKPIDIRSYPKKEMGETKVQKTELTKEKYIELKQNGKTDYEIMKEYKLHNVSFYDLKKVLGLKGVRIDVNPAVTDSKPDDITKAVEEENKVAAASLNNVFAETFDELEKKIAELTKENEQLRTEVQLKDENLDRTRVNLDASTKQIIELLDEIDKKSLPEHPTDIKQLQKENAMLKLLVQKQNWIYNEVLRLVVGDE